MATNRANAEARGCFAALVCLLAAGARVAAAGDTYVDLALNRGTRMVVSRPAMRIDMGSKAARALLVSGWSRDERRGSETWVWALGHEARIRFEHEFSPSPHQLVVDFKQSHQHQTVSVEINGIAVGQVQPAISSPEETNVVALMIPSGVLRSGIHEILLKFTHFGASPNDSREMAAAFRSLEFRPLSGQLRIAAANGEIETVAENFTHSAIRWFSYVPPQAELVFGLQYAGSDPLAAGLELEVRIGAGEKRATVWRGGPDALRAATREHRIGLSAYQGTYTYIEFRVDNPRAEHGGLAQITYLNPRIVVPTAPHRPNVVLITLDSLRPDHVGCYGYEVATTPNIDRLAKDAVRFTTAIAPSSWTHPSLLSMMLGRYPCELADFSRAIRSMPPDMHALAEVFAAHGYRTLGVTSSEYTSSRFGLARGFDVFDDMEPGKRYFRPAAEISQRFSELWNDAADDPRPVFTWVHLFEPHWPYNPPIEFFEQLYGERGERFRSGHPDQKMFDWDPAGHWKHAPNRSDLPVEVREFFVEAYDANIRCGDAGLGKIVEHVSRTLDLDDTLLVITADHGESLGEDHWYFTHSQNLRQELIQVPLIVRYPRRFKTPRVIQTPVSMSALAPTLLNLTDLPVGRLAGQYGNRRGFFQHTGNEMIVSDLTNQNKIHRLPQQDSRQFSFIRKGEQLIWYERRERNAVERFKLGSERWKPVPGGRLTERIPAIRSWVVAHRRRATGEEEISVQELPPDVIRRLQAVGYLKDLETP